MIVYYAFAALLIFLGWKSLRGGIEYLEFFKRELEKENTDYAPFSTIIAPCRGIDKDLRENLAALFRQDHPAYEIIFVVGEENDPAISVIEKLRGENGIASRIVIAGKASDEGQKVHNLRCAVSQASHQSEIFVFVDSDARPSANWLRDLIAPLKDKKIGAATGYRWFISKNRGFFSEMLSVWNASIASALGADTKKNFCWGGSTAIRRETFEKEKIRERWKGTLSDDFMITRVLAESKLPIFFVPQALTASIENCRFGELLEFTNRQMKITRAYAAHLWKASFIGSFLFSATFYAGVLLLFFTGGWHFFIVLASLLAIFALGFAKAYFRFAAVKMVLKDHEQELSRGFYYQTFLWFLSPPLYLVNSVSALISRRITWRGIDYEIKSPTEVKIL